MTITIINDCQDANAAGRQLARAESLFDAHASLIGVSNDLEAAGNLIDILDALNDRPGVILVNVAPRNGRAKKWKNGTPFGYFWYERSLVIASIDGLTLSLVKKLKLISEVCVLDIPTIATMIDPSHAHQMINTQFRSFDFLPRVAKYIWDHRDIAHTQLPISEIADAPTAIWWVDNFGNCKTTCLVNEPIPSDWEVLPFYPRLKDVPDHQTARIIGSSGIGEYRFLELVTQGGRAIEHVQIKNSRSC